MIATGRGSAPPPVGDVERGIFGMGEMGKGCALYRRIFLTAEGAKTAEVFEFQTR